MKEYPLYYKPYQHKPKNLLREEMERAISLEGHENYRRAKDILEPDQVSGLNSLRMRKMRQKLGVIKER